MSSLYSRESTHECSGIRHISSIELSLTEIEIRIFGFESFQKKFLTNSFCLDCIEGRRVWGEYWRPRHSRMCFLKNYMQLGTVNEPSGFFRNYRRENVRGYRDFGSSYCDCTVLGFISYVDAVLAGWRWYGDVNVNLVEVLFPCVCTTYFGGCGSSI